MFRHILLFLPLVFMLSCGLFKDDTGEVICATTDHYYNITIMKGQCFAEPLPKDICIKVHIDAGDDPVRYCKETPEGMHMLALEFDYPMLEDDWVRCDPDFLPGAQFFLDPSQLGEGDCLLHSTTDPVEGIPNWSCLESAWLITEDGTSCTAQDYPLDTCIIYDTLSFNNVTTIKCHDTDDGSKLLFYSGDGHEWGTSDWYDCNYCVSETPYYDCCIIK